MTRRLALLLLALLLALPASAQGFRVAFRFTPSGSPRTVAVAGSFNGWSPEAHPLADPDGDGVWEAEVELAEGVYTYKFVVDGASWYPDPTARESSDDGFGGVNSVVRVGEGAAGQAAEPFHHGTGPRYRNLLPDGRLRVRLRAPSGTEADSLLLELDGDVAATVTVLAKEAGRQPSPGELRAGRVALPLHPAWTDGSYDYPERLLPAGARGYRFVLPDGRRVEPEGGGWFTVPEGPPFVTPDWVPRSVFYQVFPERFANGDPANDPPGAEPWGAKPEIANHFGGDLAGIRDRLGELEDLGVGALYLNPVFAAPSNHKYDTSDYHRVDPAFGDVAALRALVAEAHARGIRVVLDGVFNHTGTGFFAFQDLVRNGESSPYGGWYFVDSFPIRMEPKPSYRAWWGYASLPKLNTGNPETRRYLLDVASRWIREARVDGWRLDVPNEVPHDFWRELRREVKQANPEAYLAGEIWGDATPWLQGDQFDGVMNYRFRTAVLAFLAEGKLDATGFATEVQKVLLDYPEQAHPCLLNLLGSHDTPRIATLMPDPRQRDLAEVLQFTLPGTPMVYYGDEIGMEGGKDPDCRRCYPADPEAGDRWRREHVRRLARLRSTFRDLQEGDFAVLHAEGRVLAFRRGLAVVAVNAGPTGVRLDLPAPLPTLFDRWTDRPASVRDGRLLLDLPPGGAAILR